MSYTVVISYLAISALLSYAICRWLVRVAHQHALLDQVNIRSSHTAPTPRIGGISFVILNSLLLIYWIIFQPQHRENFVYWMLLAPPIVIAGISIAEDITNKVSRKIRLGAHFIATAVTLSLWTLIMENNISPWLYIALFIGITWFINLFNFMDGIDGLAVTEALFILFAAIIMAFYHHDYTWSSVMLYLSGPLIGFLIINWRPAKIFMGDIGSTYLGILISTILLVSIANGTMNIWCAIILTGTFLVDATWTLAFRALSGQTWYLPHRSHSYQILARKLNSHPKVNILNLSINLFWLLPISFLANLTPNYGQIFTIIALLPLILLSMLARAGQAQSN